MEDIKKDSNQQEDFENLLDYAEFLKERAKRDAKLLIDYNNGNMNSRRDYNSSSSSRDSSWC